MAITVDWPNKIINVPKADMVLLQASPEIRQLDMDIFRLRLKELEAGEDGMPWLDTHQHNPTVTVSGAILARVVAIVNGYTVTFEDGQYRVNVVGANTNIGELTNVNQVSVSTSNSAGLQDLNSLQAASFLGRVAIDPNSSFTGTVFPVGTRAYPVNNLDDAITIAKNRGLYILNVMSSMTLTTGDASDGYKFEADSPITVTITLDPGVDVTNCEFLNATITGTLDGYNLFKNCHIQSVNFFNGAIHNCGIEGTITLGGGLQADIIDCFSGVAGGGVGQTPTVDMGGSGQTLSVRNYNGGLTITNCTGAGDSSIDVNSGRMIFDSTVTAGTFYIRGVSSVQDNSTGTATIYDLTITAETARARKLLSNRQELVDTGGDVRMRTWDDDGITVLEENIITDPADGKPDLDVGSTTKRGISQ